MKSLSLNFTKKLQKTLKNFKNDLLYQRIRPNPQKEKG